MTTAAARRAVARLDRNWTYRALLAAGSLLSIAAFLYLGHREAAVSADHVRMAAVDQAGAIRRGIESRQVLLESIARLLANDRNPAEAVQDLLDGYRGGRNEGVAVLWAPWDGAGSPPRDGPGIRRFLSGWSAAAGGTLPWLADALGRAVRAGGTITVPAAADGAELLVFAAGVRDARGRLKGVAVAMARIADVVEHELSGIDPQGVDLALEDSSLGGRQLYTHHTRIRGDAAAPAAGLHCEVPLRLADRLWTLRASAAPGFRGGLSSQPRWSLLAACLLATFLIATLARELLRRAALVRSLVFSKARRAQVANRRLRAEAAVRREAEQRLELAEESVAMGIWDFDIAADRTTATPAVFRLFGLEPAATFPDREAWLAMLHPQDRERMRQTLERAIETQSAYESEYRVVLPDGAIRWLLTKASLFRDEAGTPVRMLGINIDITNLKETELALRENQERVRRLFANAAIGVVITDAEGRIVEINDFACRAMACERARLLGMYTADFIHPEDAEAHKKRFRNLMTGAVGDYVTEVRVIRGDRSVLWLRVSASPAIEDGHCAGMVALCEDITARRRAEAQLEYQSLNDPLTGLPNRRLFDDRARQALAEVRRGGGHGAVLYVSVDGFDTISETLGHGPAEALLVEVSRRFRGCLRASDTLARITGDQFAVIAPHLQEPTDAQRVGRKLIDAMSAPFHVLGEEIALTASVGVSLFPRHSTDAAELVRFAQSALFAAKRGGRNRLHLFTPELGRALRERMGIEGQLRGAAARGEIVVHYQPEYDLRTGRLMGFEALARWKHAELGLVAPARFIPIAEETGLIVPIGMTVLEQACREARGWQKSGWPPVQVAVNVSSVQFFRDDFVDGIFDVLERTGLAPNLLQLELTESVVLTGFVGPAAKMAQLRERGISLAVDDFGTGYSSLSYLPRLPFQAMKIDRSFVRNLHELADSRAMIQSLVSLAHNLNLNVVVEGVESPEELAAVRALGCDAVQGYLLGRPSPSTDRHLEGDRRLLLPHEILACP